MNILIIGCGKTGSRLANALCKMGHDVSVVDKDLSSFDQLDNDFHGFTIAGVPIDQDILRRAGIEGCDAVAAVTDNDNINVMVSQLAHEIFHVPKVLARVYDPEREGVFSHFGLHTVCPTKFTVDLVCSMLMDRGQEKYLSFDTSTVSFTTLKATRQQVGSSVHNIRLREHETLFGVLHEDGKLSLIDGTSDLHIQETDRLIISSLVD